MNVRDIWFVDFEFKADSGERPVPVCLVAKNYETQELIRLWKDEFIQLKHPPYSVGDGSVFVSYYSTAELGCHLVLDWVLPKNNLDLFVEFRNLTNGQKVPSGNGLIGALSYYGLDSIQVSEKERLRDLILSGGPWRPEEKQEIMDYCQSDVDSLERLFRVMSPHIDMPRAILRGRYMKAAARIEHNGIPVDRKSFNSIQRNWDKIQDELIRDIDSECHVYDGRSFRTARWEAYLAENNIPWPFLSSGKLALDDETFRQMARKYPKVAPIRELRLSLSKLRLSDLAVGRDNRNRCLLSVFRSTTGRNQPSNSKFIFGPSVWLRSLIQPQPGYGLAYIDWSQQEFGIAAALSNDDVMEMAYLSGDPYLAFAKQAGAAPLDATKESHGDIRDQFKACILATQYGMGDKSLAASLNQPIAKAQQLLRLHRETYKRFWLWSDSVVDYALLHNQLWTVFGWNLLLETRINERSIRNFPMQANGAEMLRLACCYLTEQGIRVCAPVHDAVLIEAPLNQLNETVQLAQKLMADASAVVLDGFRLRSDAKIIRYPERYSDPRGIKMWKTISGLLSQIDANEPDQEQAKEVCISEPKPVHTCTPV